MNRESKPAPIRPDWWSKTLAGGVLGATLALALAGLFAWLGPGGVSAAEKPQFVMWSIAPLWLSAFAAVYLFRSGGRALLWMGGANLAAYALLFWVKGVI